MNPNRQYKFLAIGIFLGFAILSIKGSIMLFKIATLIKNTVYADTVLNYSLMNGARAFISGVLDILAAYLIFKVVRIGLWLGFALLLFLFINESVKLPNPNANPTSVIAELFLITIAAYSLYKIRAQFK